MSESEKRIQCSSRLVVYVHNFRQQTGLNNQTGGQAAVIVFAFGPTVN
jgi:hypothetical protein